MSMEKLASLLHVDEVEVHHGELGYALYVKLGTQTIMSTFDHAEITKSGEKHRMHALAKSLMSLADQMNGRINETATRAALEAEAAFTRRVASRPLYEERGRQLQRTVQAPAYSSPPPTTSEVAVTKSMPSRFHAIVAELNKL